MKNDKLGICKFCGQEKKLIKAHIIPKKFYVALKNDKYFGINSETGKYSIQQQGAYDSNILCGDCDNNILGELDKEGYRVLFGDFNKYKCILSYPQYKIYQLSIKDFDLIKLRKFFISILWRASISKLEECSKINLGPYEKRAFEILNDKRSYDELFKILIYKNVYNEGLNQQVLIGKGKTKTYKKYVIQIAGYRIEVIVDSRRLTKECKRQYEKYFLNSEYAHIIETPEVSQRINKDFNQKMEELYKKGFIPPKP